MDEKNKADCLIALHKEQLSKFKQTRNIEFKINMVLWSAIVIAGYHLKSEFYLKDCRDYAFYAVISIGILYAHYKFWMFPITKSEEIDNYFINKYRFEVEKLIGVTISEDSQSNPKMIKEFKFKDFNPSSRSWIIFEVSITVFLLLIVGVYLSLQQGI